MASNDKKVKIFIVDDDKFLLDMYSIKFIEQGFDVETSLSSDEALQKLRDGSVAPVALLLDIVMPSMDGFELLKKIKEESLVPGAFIIFLSNLGESQEIERAKSMGVDGYIIKASRTPSEVVEKVVELLATKKS
ncbi:MAG TPA: response regulator [Candidatus Paceibacterota bacterium]